MKVSEKGLIREFELVVYPVPLVAVFGDVEEEVNKLYSPMDEEDKKYDVIGKPVENYEATVYHVRNKETGQFCLMVWFPTMDNYRGNTCCHEAGHIALEIFKYVGAKVDFDNQEPFCYLLGNIFRLINGAFYEWKDYLEKKKEKTKG